MAGPRRRRGGDREVVLGGVACMHQASGAAWVAAGTFQATCGGQRNARGGPGATQSGGRAAHGTGGGKQGSRLEKKMRTILQFPKVPGAKL